MRKHNNYQIIELTQDTDDKFWQQRIDFFMKYRRPTDIQYSDIADAKKRLTDIMVKNSFYSSCMVFDHADLQAIFIFRSEEGKSKEQEIFLFMTCRNGQCSDDLLDEIIGYVKSKISEDYTLNIKINSLLNENQIEKYRLKTRALIHAFLLPKADLKQKLMNSWKETYQLKNRDLRMELYTELPQDLIGEYVGIYSSFYDDLPQMDIPISVNVKADEFIEEQKAFQEKGNLVYWLIAFNQNNQIVALTYVEIYKHASDYAYQCMTGVIREYRGRGISKWFKSVMYPLIFEKHPELKGIVTDMQTSNSYIINVNRELGYKKFNQSSEFIMSKEDFNKWRTNYEIL